LLSVEVWHSWTSEQKRWNDSKSHRLEELIAPMVASFIRIAAAERAGEERRVAAELQRQRLAQERACLDKLIRTEESKVRVLHRATANWLHAEQLRAFVSAARLDPRPQGRSGACAHVLLRIPEARSTVQVPEADLADEVKVR
jgi:hypothetical protein